MSIQVTFYNFKKRANSTARPRGAAIYGMYNCQIREGCSIRNPVILFRASRDPSGVNYAYIIDYNSYYWVDQATYEGGLWSISMHIDPLATYQNDIKNAKCYVLRSSARCNPNIIDTMYPTDNKYQQGGTFDSPFDYTGETYFTYCTFIVGIIGSYQGQTSASVYYALNQAQFRAFVSYLMSDDFMAQLGIDDISSGLSKMVFNPFQYVTSCFMLPWAKDEITTASSTPINFGWWRLPDSVTGTKITPHPIVKDIDLTHPINVQADENTEYLNKPPYTNFTISMPAFGDTPIDLSSFSRFENIHLRVICDPVTGLATLDITHGSASGALNLSKSTNLAIPVQIAQMGVDYLHANTTVVQSVASTVGNALSLNIGGAIASAASGIQSSIKASMPKLDTSGTQGSTAQYSRQCRWTATFYSPVNMAPDEKGRPLCDLVTLGEIPGFIMCADPDPKISCNAAEYAEIVQYMTSGFFLED